MEDVTITYIGEKIEEKAKHGRFFNVVSQEKSQPMIRNDLELSAGFAENFLHVLLLDLNLLQLCQDILAGFLHEAHQMDVKFISETGQECVEEEGGGDGEERPVEAGGEEEEAAREDGAGEEPTFPEYQSHQQTHCVNLPAENLTYKLL